jgi:hypothetical protein
VLRALRGVKAAELEQALLLLPFGDALRLLRYLLVWLRRGVQVSRSALPLEVPLGSSSVSLEISPSRIVSCVDVYP